MNILEIAQLIFYITVSCAVIAITVFILMAGAAFIKLLVTIREGIESVKKESAAIKERVQKTLDEVSVVTMVSKISSWFSKKRSGKKSSL